MPQIVRNNYTNLDNLSLTDSLGIQFTGRTADPADADLAEGRLYYDSANNRMRLYNGASWETLQTTTLSGVVVSLDDAYNSGRTVTVDAGAVTLNGVNMDTAVLALTGDGDSAGALLTFSHTTNTRNDILGTGSTWAITGQGAATFTAIDMQDNELITFGTGNDATIGWDGSVLNIAGATDFDNNITMAASATITQTGVAGSAVYTISAGDVVWSDTSLSLTDADNAESVTIINNTATTIGAAASAGVVQIESTSLTTGAALNVQLTEGTLNGGFYFRAWDATAGAAVWTVAENGAMTIGGGAGNDVLTLTAGDAVLSDGSLTITDADDAPTVSVTNNTATTSDVFLLTGSGVFTGTGASAFMAITQSGATSGDVVSVTANGLTTGTAMLLTSTGTIATTGRILEMVADSATTSTGLVSLTADALTTGVGLLVASESNEAMTSGQLASFVHSASGTTVAAKTGSVISLTSSITESGTSTQDYDVLSLSRTSIHDTAGTLTAQGSVLRISVTSTETAATLTDTVAGIEVSMGVAGTGDGIDVTTSNVAARGLDVNVAVTTVPGIDLDGTGAQANNVGLLDVASSGATAAGGSVLRVSASGTPAAATSYLVDFDYTGATFTNNPDAVHIASAGTGRALHITGSGAATAALVDIESTDTGTTGAVLRLAHQGGDQANSDVVGRIVFMGEDDASADENYGRIDVVVTDITAANPDGEMNFLVNVAGTLTQRLQVSNAINGIEVGDGSAAGLVSANGSQDLTLTTNNLAANEPRIVLTDGATGNITLTAGGTSGEIDLASPVMMSSTQALSGAGAVNLTTSITEVTTTGANALTLGDGVEGQMKFITMVVDAGDGTLTPTNLLGYTTITFNDVGDSVLLLFTNGNWCVISNQGATLA